MERNKMKFRLPWKSGSLFIILLIAVSLFSPSRMQSLLGIGQGLLILLELALLIFAGFNFLVMFNQEVISEAAFRETYGWVMYLVYWISIIAVILLALLVLAGERFLRLLI
jgi:hypothetical protein